MVNLLRQFLVDHYPVLVIMRQPLIPASCRMGLFSTQETIDARYQLSSCEGLRHVMIGSRFVACQNIPSLLQHR